MDPFAVPEFLGGDPVPDVPEIDDLDFDIQFDGSDIMDLDCDPDFNNFLRELANEVRPKIAGDGSCVNAALPVQYPTPLAGSLPLLCWSHCL